MCYNANAMIATIIIKIVNFANSLKNNFVFFIFLLIYYANNVYM